MTNTSYKTILSTTAGVMLLLAIPSTWPYAYYQLLRLVVTCAAVYNGYQEHNRGNRRWVLLMGIIAILFNPIAPIYLAKEIWMFLDVSAAAVFFIYISQKHE